MNYQHRFDSIVAEHTLGGKVTDVITTQMIQSVSLKTLYSAGFRNWDEHLMLLPIWALPMMQDGSELVSIMGERVRVGTHQIDLDTRGGCIAYGVYHNGLNHKELDT